MDNINDTSEIKHVRPLCSKCKQRPSAFNYKRKGKIYYRSKCDQCIKEGLGLKTGFKSSWEKAGYRKKSICEKCAFKSKHPAQMDVYHIDGNLKNASWNNLKTICANCGRIKAVEEIGWKQGGLMPDKA
ncbi:MAG: hypothetical protein CMA64_00960 [Euryarchaeota archaeon]|nr:hypothetical protein [Euryarchaeota archaeon]